MKAPTGLAEILKVYGDPFKAGIFAPNGDIIDDKERAWRRQILAPCALPAPLGGPDRDGDGKADRVFQTIWCHKLIVVPLTVVLVEIYNDGLWPSLKTFNGCYALRSKRGLTKLSVHSWAAALDFNSATNRLGTKGDMDPKIVAAFERNGWRWGGRWERPDAMHFQFCFGY
jgi:hypothetical protein